MPLQHHPSSILLLTACKPTNLLKSRSRARRSSENCDRAFSCEYGLTAEQRATKGKKSSFAEEEAMAAASPAAIILAFLARPLSLLRHVAHGLASRLKLAAASASASVQQEEAAAVVAEEVVVVEMRSRGVMAPQRPRGLREGKGGNGGPHH